MHVSHVPHIQAVVVVQTAEPAVGGVVGEADDIWVMGVCFGGTNVAAERERERDRLDLDLRQELWWMCCS